MELQIMGQLDRNICVYLSNRYLPNDVEKKCMVTRTICQCNGVVSQCKRGAKNATK